MGFTYKFLVFFLLSTVLAQQDADAIWNALHRGRLEVNVVNYSHLLHVLGTQGRISDMMKVYDEMFDVGVEPNAISYTNMISACANQRNMDAALHILDKMKSSGIRPTVVTYGAAMKACVNCNALERAFGLLGEAEKNGVPLNTELFTHLIVGCIHQGNIDLAWKTFDHMRIWHCAPDAVAYTAMISACGRTDNVERALNLYTEMLQYGVSPTHVTFNALIYACARSFRRFNHAFNLVEEMKANGYAPDIRTYNSLLLACSHTGQVNKAKSYMYQMHSDGLQPDIVTFNTMISVYARAMLEHGPKAQRRHLARMDPEERREVELESRVSGEELLDIDAPEGSKHPSTDLKVVNNKDLKELSIRLLSEYYNTKNKEGTENYSKQELDILEEGPDHPAFDPPSSEPGEGSWSDLRESSYQDDRQAWIEGGMGEGAIKDMEWEFVHGRPDTDTENSDPEIQSIIKRRVERGQSLAKRESNFRKYMGLQPSHFEQIALEEEDELRDIADQTNIQVPADMKEAIPRKDVGSSKGQGALDRFQEYFEQIREKKRERLFDSLKERLRSKTKRKSREETPVHRRAQMERADEHYTKANENLMAAVTKLFSHSGGLVDLAKIAESSNVSYNKLLKLQQKLQAGVPAPVAISAVGIDPEYEMSRLMAEVGHDIREAYNTEPDTEAELENISVKGIPATEYIYRTDSENDWKPDFSKDDISKMGDIVEEKLEEDFQRKLRQVSEELDKQLQAWGDRDTTDADEQSAYLQESYKQSLEKEPPALRTVLNSEFLQNPDTPEKVEGWHTYLDLLGNLSDAPSNVPQVSNAVQPKRESLEDQTLTKTAYQKQDTQFAVANSEIQSLNDTTLSGLEGSTNHGSSSLEEPYPGYDPTHVVSSNGIVWEQVADDDEPPSSGLVRRRRSGWAIEGYDYLPRPASLVRPNGEDVSCFLRTDPTIAQDVLQTKEVVDDIYVHVESDNVGIRAEPLKSAKPLSFGHQVEGTDQLTALGVKDTQQVYSQFIKERPRSEFKDVEEEDGVNHEYGTENADTDVSAPQSWTDSMSTRFESPHKNEAESSTNIDGGSMNLAAPSLVQESIVTSSVDKAVSSSRFPDPDEKDGDVAFDQELGSVLDENALGRLGEEMGYNLGQRFKTKFNKPRKESKKIAQHEPKEPEINRVENVKRRLQNAADEFNQPLGDVERALIAATDSKPQAEKRESNDTPPSTMDSFLAVKKFEEGWLDRKDLYERTHSESIKQVASSLNEKGDMERDTVDDDQLYGTSGILSQYGKKVMNARARLASAISPGSKGELRLRALQKFSEELFAGAHWAPTELPKDVNEARKVFMEETFNTYEELKRSGYKPDKFTLNSVVAACTNAGKAKLAYKFIQEEFTRYAVMPDERTFRALLRMVSENANRF